MQVWRLILVQRCVCFSRDDVEVIYFHMNIISIINKVYQTHGAQWSEEWSKYRYCSWFILIHGEWHTFLPSVYRHLMKANCMGTARFLHLYSQFQGLIWSLSLWSSTHHWSPVWGGVPPTHREHTQSVQTHLSTKNFGIRLLLQNMEAWKSVASMLCQRTDQSKQTVHLTSNKCTYRICYGIFCLHLLTINIYKK